MHARIRDRAGRARRRGGAGGGRWAASVAALLVLALAGVALSFSPAFDLREVRVIGVDGARADEVRDWLGIAPAPTAHGRRRGRNPARRRLPWVASDRGPARGPVGHPGHGRGAPPRRRAAPTLRVVLVAADGVLDRGGTDPALAYVDARTPRCPTWARRCPRARPPALGIHTALSPQTRALVDRYERRRAGPVRLHPRARDPVPARGGLLGGRGRASSLPAKEQAIRLSSSRWHPVREPVT